MLNYWDYLLTGYDSSDNTNRNIQGSIRKDEESGKFITNVILDTEFKSYLDFTTDYVQPKYEGLSGITKLLDLDAVVLKYKDNIVLQDLRDVISVHYSPIWRVAAFFTDFIIQLHREYS